MRKKKAEGAQIMVGVYFSGTGNSRHSLEVFCKEIAVDTKVISIEEEGITDAIKGDDTIVIAYPVQYSTVPIFLRDFVTDNSTLWNGKKIFVIATMGMFSGDGAGMLGRLLKKYGAEIVGGLHVKMPDNITDVKLLKHPMEVYREIVRKSDEKVRRSAQSFKAGKPKKEGLNVFYRLAGFFGQRLYFGHMTKKYSDKLKIDKDQCIGCGKCETLCPTKNITIKDQKAVAGSHCTMCYRCINNCPKKAITLLGKTVGEQWRIDRFAD